MKTSLVTRLAMFTVLAVSVSTTACTIRARGIDGNGEWVNEPRPLRDFSKVVFRGPLDARIREGGDYAVAVWIDANLKQFVTTAVSGDTLVVDATKVIYPQGRAVVEIRVPRLDAFSHEGSGTAVITGAVPHSAVELAIIGSGALQYQGNADKLDATVTGSGDMKLTGATQRLEAEVKGSGDIDARQMPAVGGRFAIAGSGDILANLRGGEISCKINGSGDIRWLGTARVTSMDSSGSGTAQQL
jgi:hypothetical protein